MKWHYTTIHFGAMIELGLSAIEYIVSDITYHRTSAGTSWWAYSPTEIGELLGISENTVRDIVARCVEKGTIGKDSKQIITCQRYIDVVYPPSGINSRSSGINSREATGETPALLNIYSKKINSSVSPRVLEIKEVPDLEENERPAGRLLKTEKEKLLPLIGWAERERGFNFLSTAKGKQLKALSLAKANGLKAAQLKERWEEMSVDKFWAKAGFDWYNVVQSFNKKGV